MNTYYNFLNRAYWLVVLYCLLPFQMTFAQFSLNNNTITQTGTAANLDNIENKSDSYEEYSFGTLQGQTLKYRRAVLNGRNLIIQGAMTLNPDPDALNQDELFLGPSSPDNTIVVQSGGELILGGYVTNVDGTSRVANGTALRAFMRGGAFYQNGAVTVRSGGKLTEVGSTVLTDAAIRVESGGIINLTDANWASTRRHTTRNGGLGPIYRLETNQITANGWSVTGQRLNILTDDLSPVSIAGLVMRGANLFFQERNSSSNSWTTLEDFGGFIGGGTTTVWGRQYGVKFLNAKDGGNLPSTPASAVQNNGSIIETAATVKFVVTNPQGNPIENTLVYGKAIDHVLPSAVLVPTGMDYPNQNGVYNELTNANGETSAMEIKINYGYQNGSGSRELLWRSNTNNTEDFVLYHYTYNNAGVTVDLLGTGLKTIPWTLFDDLSVTESNRATVDAYSSIDNLDQLYDRAKSWKVTATNIAFPSIDQLLLTAEGTVVNTGNYDLILDGTAGGVFTVVNSPAQSITVQTTALAASSQFSSLQSSGTISFVNGATLEAGYQDATGDYAYVELTNLDQQDLAITAMNAGVSSTLVNLSNFTGTYKGHIALPSLTASITVTARRDGYAPWTDMLPVGDLIFKREVNTSLASVTGVNQNVMVHLTTKLLQKTEALSHALYNTNNPVPTITVSLTTTSPTNVPSVTNQETILDLLYRILGKTTRLREAVQE